MYRDFIQNKYVQFPHILNEIKRLNIKYNRQARKKGFMSQGCLLGIKKIKQEIDIDIDMLDSPTTIIKEVMPEMHVMEDEIFKYYDDKPLELINKIKQRYPSYFNEERKTITVKGKK
jgi:hypothetical protein